MSSKVILNRDILSVIGDVSYERAEKMLKLRTRDWAFIVYPDSCPDNWIDILRDTYLPMAISPLHDKDFNANGEAKKAHYHIMLCADGNKSFMQLFELAKSVNGTSLINIDSARGYYRYLCHLDNPEKAQYSEADIRTYGGFDSNNYSAPTSAQRYNMIAQMIDYINQNNIRSYNKFLYWCSKNQYDWFKLLCDRCTIVIAEAIKSKKFDKTSDSSNTDSSLKVNVATGEIVSSMSTLLDIVEDNPQFD